MSLKKKLKDLFIMSKSERNGTVVLLALLILLVILRFYIPMYLKNNESYIEDIEEKIVVLQQFNDSVSSLGYSQQQEFDNNNNIQENVLLKSAKISGNREIEYFNFNPNTIEYKDLMKLGFNAKAANTLINYRIKGGKFKRSTDLKKIYGVDSILFQELEPYISIPKANINRKQVVNEDIRSVNSLEINAADSIEWLSLPGIGPVFAGRICKYRNYLGGYIGIEQLKEVYNLPEETFDDIIKYLTVDTIHVKKININFTTITELKKHPYCDYNLARKIVDYRSNQGELNSVNQLVEDSVISLSKDQKFISYLIVNQE